MRNAITVNGKIIDEYLRDNEEVKSEVERNKLFDETKGVHYLNNRARVRYKPLKEKNGKVRNLSQSELNKANYNEYMKKTIKEKAYIECMIIVMMCRNEHDFHTTKTIADEIFKFGKENDVIVPPTMRHALRAKLGYIRKSELAKHLEFHERNTPENKTNVSKFRIKPTSLELSINKMVELGRTLRKGEKFNPGPKKKNPLETVLKPIPEPPPMEPPDTIDRIKNMIYDISKNAGGINFHGDIHVHIHLKS